MKPVQGLGVSEACFKVATCSVVVMLKENERKQEKTEEVMLLKFINIYFNLLKLDWLVFCCVESMKMKVLLHAIR